MKKLLSLFLMLLIITIFFSCNSPTTAVFRYSQGEDGAVTFLDSSQNAKTYQWDFGDGTYDNTQKPTHKFENNGTYNVKLTTFNGKDSASSIVSVEVSSIKKASCVFWGKKVSALPIEIYVDNILVGNITKSYDEHPNIPFDGCYVFETTPGIHAVTGRANNGTVTWPVTNINFLKGERVSHYFGGVN